MLCYTNNSTPSYLKRQVPRLRDWNIKLKRPGHIELTMLETTSTSITRLKLTDSGLSEVFASRTLKRQVPRLRDWNVDTTVPEPEPESDLKRQVPRLRDWNCCGNSRITSKICSLKRQVPRLRDWNPHWRHRHPYLLTGLETTRTSITRLKLVSVTSKRSKASILETTRTSITRLKRHARTFHTWQSPLETTSTSITRLKHQHLWYESIIFAPWNDKPLDSQHSKWVCKVLTFLLLFFLWDGFCLGVPQLTRKFDRRVPQKSAKSVSSATIRDSECVSTDNSRM